MHYCPSGRFGSFQVPKICENRASGVWRAEPSSLRRDLGGGPRRKDAPAAGTARGFFRWSKEGPECTAGGSKRMYLRSTLCFPSVDCGGIFKSPHCGIPPSRVDLEVLARATQSVGSRPEQWAPTTKVRGVATGLDLGRTGYDRVPWMP